MRMRCKYALGRIHNVRPAVRVLCFFSRYHVFCVIVFCVIIVSLILQLCDPIYSSEYTVNTDTINLFVHHGES